jgi:predicted DNA-binding transcriptional regulator AlpA
MADVILEPECAVLSGLAQSTRWRLEKRGLFPRRFKVGDPNAVNGRVAWSRREIEEWIASRMAARTPIASLATPPQAPQVAMSKRPRGRPRKAIAAPAVAAEPAE